MSYLNNHKIKNFVTLVIISYQSKKILLPILKNFSRFLKIIIIENSKDKSFKQYAEKKFKNVEIHLQNNIGYGAAINYASKYVTTKYFFAINPDVKFKLICLINLFKAAQKLKGNFGGLNPKNKYQKLNNERKIEQVKSINGSAMFFSVKVFKKIGGFDKNIWLFLEENDFCVRANRLNYNLYIINDAIAYHKGGESMDKKSNENEHNMLMVKYWHGQWSRYYFYKKHHGTIKALFSILPKFLKLQFQLFITFFYSPKKSKQYLFQLHGMISSIIGRQSFLRPGK